jgi:hypothetical protein
MSIRDNNVVIIARVLYSLIIDITASSQTSQHITDIIASSQTTQHNTDIAASS